MKKNENSNQLIDDNKLREVFGKRLKDICRKNGISREELSQRMHYQKDTITNWWVGKSMPNNPGGDYYNLIKFLRDEKGIDVSLDYLLDLEDAKTHDASFVINHTGLTEDSVSRIMSFKNDNTGIDYAGKVDFGDGDIRTLDDYFLSDGTNRPGYEHIESKLMLKLLNSFVGSSDSPLEPMFREIINGYLHYLKHERCGELDKSYEEADYSKQIADYIEKCFEAGSSDALIHEHSSILYAMHMQERQETNQKNKELEKYYIAKSKQKVITMFSDYLDRLVPDPDSITKPKRKGKQPK